MSAIGPQFYDFLTKLEANNGKLPTSVTSRAFQPEFEFNNSACYLCNGYYGPSFGEPVCVTCHEFLYPDIPHHLPNSYILSEKTEDGDSGNDEPSVGELLYNDRRLTRALHQPKWAFRFQPSLDSEASPEDPIDAQNAREDWIYVSCSNSRSAGSVECPSRDYEGPSGSLSGPSDHREGPNNVQAHSGPSSGPKHGAIPKIRLGEPNQILKVNALFDQVKDILSSDEPTSHRESPTRLPKDSKEQINDYASGSSSAGPSTTKEGPSYGPSEGASFGPEEGSNSSSSGLRDVPSGSNSAPNLFSPSRSSTGFRQDYNWGWNVPSYGAARTRTNRDPNDPDDSSDDSPIDDRVPLRGPMDYYFGNFMPNRRPVYDDGLGPAVPDDGVIRPLPSCLARSIAALSTPRPADNLAPGLVESLPSEVVLCVFGYLDDLSLSACARVCVRWARLVRARVAPPRWAAAAQRRWPLYHPHVLVPDWHKKYQALVESCFCRNCVVQMCMQSQPPFEENAWRRNRLRNEIKMLRNTPPEGCAALPLDPKCCHWQAMVTGPVGSPYEGGVFYLYIQVPYSYPMSPPVVRFLTRILHPNVSRHGDVGIDSVHHNWSLALTISKLLISIQSLLTDPYTAVCMEPEVGEMYVNERARFERIARRWTWRYAMHDMYSI